MYLLTRPKPKLMSSVTRFQSSGLATVGIATFDIEPDRIAINFLAQLAASMQTAYVVTSTFAASIVGRERLIPTFAPIVAVGPSTAQILQLEKYAVELPDTYDSEGVVKLFNAKSTKPTRVIIIKGEGGRTEIKEKLLAQGIDVMESNVYHRVKLPSPVATSSWDWQSVKGIIATSTEQTDGLIDAYQLRLLRSKRWLVVSERIKRHAQLNGITNVDVCNSASDIALIDWIKKNWE